MSVRRAVCDESCSHGSESAWGKQPTPVGDAPSFDSIRKHLLAGLGRIHSSFGIQRSETFHSLPSSWTVLPVSTLKICSLYFPSRMTALIFRTSSLSYFSVRYARNAAD